MNNEKNYEFDNVDLGYCNSLIEMPTIPIPKLLEKFGSSVF